MPEVLKAGDAISRAKTLARSFSKRKDRGLETYARAYPHSPALVQSLYVAPDCSAEVLVLHAELREIYRGKIRHVSIPLGEELEILSSPTGHEISPARFFLFIGERDL